MEWVRYSLQGRIELQVFMSYELLVGSRNLLEYLFTQILVQSLSSFLSINLNVSVDYVREQSYELQWINALSS